jgi:hypothetical protein
MKLWQVDHTPNVSRFEPRIPPSVDAGVTRPVVWAVADSHLVIYLVARDGPRVAVRRRPQAAQSDAERYFTASSPAVVINIEAPWFERAQQALWLYELPSVTFHCVDATAGYSISSEPVVPLSCVHAASPLAELTARGAELRIVARLRPIAQAVAASSLTFSIIRLRQATVDGIDAPSEGLSPYRQAPE